jgi:MFS family permease
VFYGWVIVGVSLLAHFTALGTAFYSWGPLIQPLEADLDAPRAQVATAMSFLTALGILGGPIVGWLVDRGSVRRVMLAGAVSFAIGVLALAEVRSVWQLWLVYAGPIALGMALLGGVANPRLIASWFTLRRGVALGVAMMGVSLAGVVMPVLMGELVAALGWRGAVRALVVLPLGLVPLLFLVVDEPAARGLHPDGLAQAPAVAPGAADLGFLHVLAMPATWLIGLCFALALTPNAGMVTQVYEHARDLGFERASMGLAVTFMAVGGGLGKPAYGWLADRFGPRRSLVLALALMFAALILFLRATDVASLFAAACLFGLGYAGLMPLQAALVGEVFGKDVLGRVLGLVGLFIGPFTVAVHPVMGRIHDTTGSYDLAFQLFAGCCVLAAVILAVIPGRERRREAVPAA